MKKEVPASLHDTLWDQAPIHLLLRVALAIDILTPILIMYGIIPAQIRWLSRIAIAAMLTIAYVRMMLVNGVPSAVLVAIGASVVGIAVALSHGQGVLPTVWGWWVVFQFPIVGLFAYLQPGWPDRFAARLSKFCIVLLAIQVLLQIGQYLSGQAPGDHLSGLFGRSGTGKLVIFILFVYCTALGRWLADGEWRPIIITLLLGSVSSALGEMKFFVPAVAALSVLAATVSAVQQRSLRRVLPFALATVTLSLISIAAYDWVIRPTDSKSLEAFLLDQQTRDRYLGGINRTPEGVYRIGRNQAFSQAIHEISETNFTVLFGFGLGARRGSKTLGTEGAALAMENVSFDGGSSLLLLVQELGLLGMALVAVCSGWIIVALLRSLQRHPLSESTQLRYALLLFTCLFPLWMWYNRFLTLRVPMLLYWTALGYVLSETSRVACLQSDLRFPKQRELSC